MKIGGILIPSSAHAYYNIKEGTMSDGHKVYVGNLPSDIRERDLEDMFYKYGKIVEVDLHARKGIPFAFIEFEDSRYMYAADVNSIKVCYYIIYSFL